MTQVFRRADIKRHALIILQPTQKQVIFKRARISQIKVCFDDFFSPHSTRLLHCFAIFFLVRHANCSFSN
jgi:hypothetical protein